jgi:serine/threonine-protein kinase
MGVVFVGYQKTLKRQVAVKVLLKSRDSTELSSDLFRDEGEMVAVLSHPNIIPIFEMGETDDCYFQVMQLVDGIDLRTTLRQLSKHPVPSRRFLGLSETIEIILQILDALGYAHEEGIIHQDVKPANILIEKRGNRPLVADFGIARALAGEYKSGGLVVGTPLYMSPEQAVGKVTDGRTDIYSVGVILFEMCAGKLPVRPVEKAEQILSRKKNAPVTFFTERPSIVSMRIDVGLERIILKAIAPSAEWRYASCGDFASDLKKYRSAHLALSDKP